MAATVSIDPSELVDPTRYARDGYPHELWTRLRAEAPVAYFEPPGYEPFWAVTKHHDITEVAKQPLRFSSARGIMLLRTGEQWFDSEMIVMLDPPRHGPLRRVMSGRFTPRALRDQRAAVERIAVEILDAEMPEGAAGEFDFVERIAGPFPLAVIASMLGVPRADWRGLFRWSDEIIGKEDPEYQLPGETPDETAMRARRQIHSYFRSLIEERRNDPRDDLLSGLLGADIDGTPLTAEQVISYCELLVEAGNETTRNAISGGLLAFAEHRSEWEKLRSHPDLMPNAVEEILRWVTPIIYFKRTTTEDCEVHGTKIRAGDQVAMYFASGNRDEEVFDDPFAFRVDRRPNPHLTFGFGQHICLGAHLARLELDVIFRKLLERLDHFEVSGPVARLNSNINGSIKHVPLGYRIAPASGT